MAENIIADAYVALKADKTQLTKDMSAAEKVVKNSAAKMTTTFYTNFRMISAAAVQMGSQLKTALASITVPMAVFGAKAMQAFFKDTTRATEDLRRRMTYLTQEINNGFAKVGAKILETVVHGKKIIDWIDVFAKKLNSLSTTQIQKIVNLFVKLSVTLAAISASMVGLQFSQGFVATIEAISKMRLASAAGTAAGTAGGTAVGRVAGTAAGYLGGRAILKGAKTLANSLRISESEQIWEAIGLPFKTRIQQLLGVFEKIKPIFVQFGAAISIVLAEILGVFAILGMQINYLNGKMDAVKTPLENLVDGLKTVFGPLKSFFDVIADFLKDKYQLAIFGSSFKEWKQKINKEVYPIFDQLGKSESGKGIRAQRLAQEKYRNDMMYENMVNNLSSEILSGAYGQTKGTRYDPKNYMYNKIFGSIGTYGKNMPNNISMMGKYEKQAITRNIPLFKDKDSMEKITEVNKKLAEVMLKRKQIDTDYVDFMQEIGDKQFAILKRREEGLGNFGSILTGPQLRQFATKIPEDYRKLQIDLDKQSIEVGKEQTEGVKSLTESVKENTTVQTDLKTALKELKALIVGY